MNKKIKDRWVKALRSGKYQQGKGVLCNINSETGKREYCCLGVLSDLAVKSRVLSAPKRVHDDIEGDVFKYTDGDGEECSYYTPRDVAEWAGLPWIDPSVAGAKLSQHNDGNEIEGVYRKDFDEIADLIDKEL
jgi:hypothetical protein